MLGKTVGALSAVLMGDKTESVGHSRVAITSRARVELTIPLNYRQDFAEIDFCLSQPAAATLWIQI
jgi:hypothetical protein